MQSDHVLVLKDKRYYLKERVEQQNVCRHNCHHHGHLVDEGNKLNNGDAPDAGVLVSDQVQDCFVQVLRKKE